MIYSESGYKVKYYRDFGSGKSQVYQFIMALPIKDRAKVMKYIEVLRQSGGVLDEPLSRHIIGKIRELRVDFGRNRYRVFYFTFVNQNIILLHAFIKRTQTTPMQEINKAETAYNNVLSNKEIYE